ncbi:PREDICTED: F-box/kelch-repeat protein At3g06240-like [Fragaria vesca subsp. vesca]|uniref:F-box/kelch-repeat protein At3g06240-like n=1 Tax=Fragaria vesca subsp. vesca TaxID=101020 RepID=UPI0002C36707|nr:PREDICTED: F-box/kelch-repeat protein At3g06240-like [Fragaria vesca subsp. vesca]
MARERQRSSSDDDAKKKQLMELPNDTLVDILLRLPAKSVGCIKCVSKTLLNMVSNISFSTLHTRSLIATNSAAADQVPRLMCCSREVLLVTLQSLKYKDNTLTEGRYAITISSSTPCFMRFVFCNVFCLGTKNGDCMLVNGLGERGLLRLPESSFATLESGPNVYRNSQFGMGFDDKTNTYKIVCVTHETDADHQLKSMTTHVLVLGTNLWRQISSPPPCELNWIHRAPVCANGAVHWWTGSTFWDDRRIVSFDLRREEFCWTPTPHHYLDSDISLFSLRGCLAMVETKRSRSQMEIWVLKNFDEKQWVRYYYNNKLPDDFSFQGSPGEWEHGIFFTSHNFCKTWVSFIDLRFGSISRVEYSSYEVVHYEYTEIGVSSYIETFLLGIYSYSETLISLKDYGDLEEANQKVIT